MFPAHVFKFPIFERPIFASNAFVNFCLRSLEAKKIFRERSLWSWLAWNDLHLSRRELSLRTRLARLHCATKVRIFAPPRNGRRSFASHTPLATPALRGGPLPVGTDSLTFFLYWCSSRSDPTKSSIPQSIAKRQQQRGRKDGGEGVKNEEDGNLKENDGLQRIRKTYDRVSSADKSRLRPKLAASSLSAAPGPPILKFSHTESQLPSQAVEASR